MPSEVDAKFFFLTAGQKSAGIYKSSIWIARNIYLLKIL